MEVDRATGLTLTRLGIDIADAETAQVKKPPTVPGVIPRSQNPQAPPITPQPPGPTGQPLPPSPTGPVGQPPAPSTPPQTSVPPELK